MASVGALGVCATTLVVPALDARPTRQARTSKPARSDATPSVGRHDRLPARAEQHLTPTPTPTRTRKRAAANATAATRRGKTQGGTGPRDHEQTPASPAPANAAPGGASEFDPLLLSQTAHPRPHRPRPRQARTEFF